MWPKREVLRIRNFVEKFAAKFCSVTLTLFRDLAYFCIFVEVYNSIGWCKNTITSTQPTFLPWRFGLYERPSSEEVCSIPLPVLATVVMRRGKKSVVRVAQRVAALVPVQGLPSGWCLWFLRCVIDSLCLIHPIGTWFCSVKFFEILFISNRGVFILALLLPRLLLLIFCWVFGHEFCYVWECSVAIVGQYFVLYLCCSFFFVL